MSSPRRRWPRVGSKTPSRFERRQKKRTPGGVLFLVVAELVQPAEAEPLAEAETFTLTLALA